MTIPDGRRQVQRVLIITLVLNLAVASGKIAVGLLTGALAILADGFHSLVDGTSNIIALIANRIAQRPPDDDHPYGHRRFETLAALLIGAFLLLVAWEIVRGAVDRLQSGIDPDLSPLAFVVMFFTLVVNIGVSTYQIREGKRLRSELLLADAANTRADVFVTLSVLLSMVLVTWTGLGWIDAVTALVVVVLIGRAAWRILKQTGRVLVDTAPYSPKALKSLVDALPSRGEVVRARSRGPVDDAHIDIDLLVDPAITAEQTAAIADGIREHLTESLVGVSEVEVHFVPQAERTPDAALVVRAAGDQLGLRTHEVFVRDGRRGRALEMHVEVPPGLSLEQAHDIVSRLESTIQDRLPDLIEVVSHIEPVVADSEGNNHFPQVQRDALKQQVVDLLGNSYPDVYWHHLRIYPAESGLVLTIHAGMRAGVSTQDAHQLAERAEALLRTKVADLERVTIHTEPVAGT